PPGAVPSSEGNKRRDDDEGFGQKGILPRTRPVGDDQGTGGKGRRRAGQERENLRRRVEENGKPADRSGGKGTGAIGRGAPGKGEKDPVGAGRPLQKGSRSVGGKGSASGRTSAVTAISIVKGNDP